MELIKQYITQSISAASNNLRLSTEKIEVVALLRETLTKSENLSEDINKMKKITELSTLGIRLNQIYNFLSEGRIDFFKISDQFREHSQYLIKDLNHMLETVNPALFKSLVKKLKGEEEPLLEQTGEEEIKANKEISLEVEEISVDLSSRQPDDNIFEPSESDKIKEELILNEEKPDEGNSFEDYEESVLKSIKPIDTLLKNLSEKRLDNEEIEKFAVLMKENETTSRKIGFNIIANMHGILSHSLLLIKNGHLAPSSELIESMRACLIVIVAVIKGKEVDITNYLNRAEEFGRKIKSKKTEENI